MFRIKILLGVFTAAFALLTFFAKTTLAQVISVDPTTRTVENSSIKIRWDLANAERIREFYYKPFSPSWNLSGAQDNEFFGNAASFFPTQYIQDVSLVGSSNSNSTWQYSISGQTARIEIHSGNQNGIPVETVYDFTAGSPSFKVTRTFGFSYWNLPPSRLVPYLIRAYHRDDFTRYAWEKTDGTVGVSDETCEYSCSPGGWKQTWIDLEAPDLNVGIGIVNLSGNPSSELWLDKDSNSNTAVISASIPNNGYSQSLTVSYLIVPHLGNYLKVDWDSPFAPAPFLDLPWDYQGKGMDFGTAARAIGSFFDHKYPLLFSEPAEGIGKTLIYTGVESSEVIRKYSGHNGYDYGLLAELRDGDFVLAPAPGIASYLWDDKGGNTIIIDHLNGFFTWFMHLRRDNLVVGPGEQPTNVSQRQQIGRVGNTGSNITGPHLHISVIRDLDRDGVLDFGSDYPYGLVDPFKWRGDFTDPWVSYGGSSSYYLWINPVVPTTGHVPSSGGSLISGWLSLIFPDDPDRGDLFFTIDDGPSSNASASLRGVSPTFNISALDALGNVVSNFVRPLNFIIDYGQANLENIIESTLSVFWFNPIDNLWEPISTSLDTENNIASTQLTHASLFVLMGEARDLVVPMTEFEIIGEEGKENWFRSEVSVALNAEDNTEGLGVEYTYFSVGNDTDWELYSSPLVFSEEGAYTIYTHSIDKGGNVESSHSITFNIDKTSPEAKFLFDPNSLDIKILGIDEGGETEINFKNKGKLTQQIFVTDKAGNKLAINGGKLELMNNSFFYIKSIAYNNDPPIRFDGNFFRVVYWIEKRVNSLKSLAQSWFDKGDVVIWINYSSSNNKSTIFVKEFGKEKKKEIRDGLVLLYLITHSGNLEIAY